MTSPRRSAVFLLVFGLLAAASPAVAQGEPATGVLHRAVQWVASCLPGGSDPAGPGSAWWTAQVVESEAPAGLALPLASDPAVFAKATTAPGVPVSSGNIGFEAPLSTDGTTRAASAKQTSASVAGSAAGSSTDVPEPGMLGLFAAGVIGLVLRRRATSAARTGIPRRPARPRKR